MKAKLIHEVRAVKGRRELANIVQAQRISEEVLKFIVESLKSGVTEIQVQNKIRREFVRRGAPVLSFTPIVAFGKNTANVHHTPNKTKLKAGDAIMLDFGTTVNGYCSDMTRTYFWGKPSVGQKKAYLKVLRAQKIAIGKIMKGEKRAKIIDASVRKFLGKNFSHGLGHGVGTVIHEWPNLKPKSEDILPAGCVMTVEPGIYFKNRFGIRIEDMILITKKGGRNVTRVSKDLKSVILQG